MKIQNPIPFLLIEGSPATLRQLISRAKGCRVFDILSLDLHNGEDMREAYEPVLKALLAKPPTPPGYPILLSACSLAGLERLGIDSEPYIDVSLMNPNFVETPKDLEPYYSNDHSVPKGHYNANSECFHPILGVTGSDWSSLIDATVWLEDEKVLQLAPTLEHVVAHIVWEITFIGFTEEGCKKIWDGIKKDIETYFEAKEGKQDLDGGQKS